MPNADASGAEKRNNRRPVTVRSAMRFIVSLPFARMDRGPDGLATMDPHGATSASPSNLRPQAYHFLNPMQPLRHSTVDVPFSMVYHPLRVQAQAVAHSRHWLGGAGGIRSKNPHIVMEDEAARSGKTGSASACLVEVRLRMRTISLGFRKGGIPQNCFSTPDTEPRSWSIVKCPDGPLASHLETTPFT